MRPQREWTAHLKELRNEVSCAKFTHDLSLVERDERAGELRQAMGELKDHRDHIGFMMSDGERLEPKLMRKLRRLEDQAEGHAIALHYLDDTLIPVKASRLAKAVAEYEYWSWLYDLTHTLRREEKARAPVSTGGPPDRP